jgi:hypothetical protein
MTERRRRLEKSRKMATTGGEEDGDYRRRV